MKLRYWHANGATTFCSFTCFSNLFVIHQTNVAYFQNYCHWLLWTVAVEGAHNAVDMRSRDPNHQIRRWASKVYSQNVSTRTLAIVYDRYEAAAA